jgi:acyl carrier protein
MNAADARALVIEALSNIAPEADFDVLPSGAVLRDELDLDSMDFLNFITALHDRTGLDIPEADYPMLATMDGAVAYLIR